MTLSLCCRRQYDNQQSHNELISNKLRHTKPPVSATLTCSLTGQNSSEIQRACFGRASTTLLSTAQVDPIKLGRAKKQSIAILRFFANGEKFGKTHQGQVTLLTVSAGRNSRLGLRLRHAVMSDGAEQVFVQLHKQPQRKTVGHLKQSKFAQAIVCCVVAAELLAGSLDSKRNHACWQPAAFVTFSFCHISCTVVSRSRCLRRMRRVRALLYATWFYFFHIRCTCILAYAKHCMYAQHTIFSFSPFFARMNRKLAVRTQCIFYMFSAHSARTRNINVHVHSNTIAHFAHTTFLYYMHN